MSRSIYAYVGKWGKDAPGTSFGFELCRYNGETGNLDPIKVVLPEIHVGAACLDAKSGILYCVDETRGMPELGSTLGGGRVFSVKLDRDTGDMTELNHRPTFAPQPSYVAFDAERRYLIVTNHSLSAPVAKARKDAFGHYQLVMYDNDASTVLYHLNEDGSIGEACDVVKHTGHGAHPKQSSPHPHSVTMSPDGKFFAVCDKGTDKVHLFTIDRAGHRLNEAMAGGKSSYPASAPRYSVFHPELPVLYFNNEMLQAVCAARYDENGVIGSIERYPTLPEGHEGPAGESSDLRLHPNGKLLYNVSRCANFVTAYSIGPDGSLSTVQALHFEATTFGGVGARGCAISPDGRYLYLAVADDGNVLKLKIAKDGTISPDGEPMRFTAAANVTFFEG